jgi:hypothetical protein
MALELLPPDGEGSEQAGDSDCGATLRHDQPEHVKRRNRFFLEDAHLPGNLPTGTGKAAAAIEEKDGAHGCLRRGRSGDTDALGESA